MLRGILSFACFALALVSYGQDIVECPQNIGFEEGTLNHWKAYTGNVDSAGNYTGFVPGVVAGRHTLIKRDSYPFKDPIAGFSTNSPTGSEYVIRLGNESQGEEAERITYTLNVPLNVDTYTIVFNYAVVLQNPDHRFEQQPKFKAEVFDETANAPSPCASFTFTAERGLPGFATSSVSGYEDVLYKPWSPVLVNLTAYRGHTVRLEFTTNDCTLGAHFGYAYIDIDENCASPITGNITCPENNKITLKAFPGFLNYRWYNAGTLATYGTGDSLVLSPVPPIGTKIAVELTPYPNSGGCTDVIYTTIRNMEPIKVTDPPANCLSVDLTSRSIVAGNRNGLSYTYWLDSDATKPVPDPRHAVSGTYYIMGRLLPSGCFSIEPVRVTITPLPPVLVQAAGPVAYPQTLNITKSFIPVPGLTYTFWKDKNATIPLKDPQNLRVGGTFYIKALSAEGCFVITPLSADITLPDVVIPNTFTPNGDGINDVLTVLIDSRIEIRSFRIFNRWGEPVFSTQDIGNFWNGSKGNAEQPSGVYFWFLEGIDNAQKYLRRGTVTIIR